MHCMQHIDYWSLRLTTRLTCFNFSEFFCRTIETCEALIFFLFFCYFIIIFFFKVWGGRKKVRGRLPRRLHTRGNTAMWTDYIINTSTFLLVDNIGFLIEKFITCWCMMMHRQLIDTIGPRSCLSNGVSALSCWYLYLTSVITICASWNIYTTGSP